MIRSSHYVVHEAHVLKRCSRSHGFALVIALSLMAFVVLLLLAMTTLVQVETRNADMQLGQLEAEQAALLGLNVAIGELQKIAGPDQRITAAASILGDTSNGHVSENPDGSSTTASSVNPANGTQGQDSWVGVWKSDTVAVGTPSYSAASPNQRKFLGWLVSSVNDTTGQFELPQTLGAVGVDVSSSANYVELATDSNDDAYIQVEKVPVTDSDIAFAFAIEDESLKADLSWSEMPSVSTSSERHQSSRLSAAPGPDYGALNGSGAVGPFDSVSYPLSSDSPYLITKGILKLSDIAGVTTSMTSSTDATNWLKDQRGHVTWGSRGVMADVKWGGLRRDLSLAFEMDGDEEVEDASKFNTQYGEFVGAASEADPLVALGQTSGMNMAYERFLYKIKKDDGQPFSEDVRFDVSVMRGPNWWALRDFANLYKRLDGSLGDYSLRARAHFPNRSSEGDVYSNFFPIITRADIWDRNWTRPAGGNVARPDEYIYRPAKTNYAPVLLGTSVITGVTTTDVDTVAQTANVAITLDPLVYLWNPYNRKLSFQHLAVTYDKTFPGRVKLTAGAFDQTLVIQDLLDNNAVNTTGSNKNQKRIYYLVKDPSGSDIVMEPGEVLVVSPGGKDSEEAYPGYHLNNNSGIIMPKLDGNNTVPMSYGNGESISVGYLPLGNQTSRYNVDLSLPADSTTSVVNEANKGEELQNIHSLLWTQGAGMNEYIDESGDTVDISVAGLATGAKQYFGIFNLLMKPANWEGEAPNPVEIFSHFNPAPMVIMRDYYRYCMPNQIYNSIFDPTSAGLLNSYGMNFSGDPDPSARSAFWGNSYADTGSTSVPMKDIPSSPILSIASFAHANLSLQATDPFFAVGNSQSVTMFPPTSVFGGAPTASGGAITASDVSWLLNDALFDRYYLSGLATDYSLSGGYTPIGTMRNTLSKFFDDDTDANTTYRDALANPVLRPYLPEGKTKADVINELDPSSNDDGYLKFPAYALISGAFNVNSTSVSAWASFLRSNIDVALTYVNGGTNSDSGSPFPSSQNPTAPGNGANSFWSSFSRLSDSQIWDDKGTPDESDDSGLAAEIVRQVRLRGPFMSLSDFINHRVSDPVDTLVNYSGALQSAIDASDLNDNVQLLAGGTDPIYSVAGGSGGGSLFSALGTVDGLKTTTGIPGEINQAGLLLPLAPRLTARADTFKIRAYGETVSLDGTVNAKAVCEAIVQRVPEYVDATSNDPWDEASGNLNVPNAKGLVALNDKFGRHYKLVSVRWLSMDEL